MLEPLTTGDYVQHTTTNAIARIEHCAPLTVVVRPVLHLPLEDSTPAESVLLSQHTEHWNHMQTRLVVPHTDVSRHARIQDLN